MKIAENWFGSDEWNYAIKKNREYRELEFNKKLISRNLLQFLKESISNKYHKGTFSQKEKSIGSVYFMGNKEVNRVKIGFTANDVKKRLSSIRSSSGCDIEVLAVFYPNYHSGRFLEKSLHKYYKDKRVLGEWFDLNGSDFNEAIYALEMLGGKLEIHNN